MLSADKISKVLQIEEEVKRQLMSLNLARSEATYQSEFEYEL